MFQGWKRLVSVLSLSGAAALAVVGGSPGLAGAAVGRGPSHPVQNELIPLYDNADPTNWTTVCSQTNGAGDGSWIIADPFQGQGVGTAAVPAWTKVIKNCYKYGRASVIGYVWTNYGQANIADLETQIKNWYSFYKGNIAGIFFDGVSDTVPGTTTSNQTFYRTLANYVHTHEGNNDEVVFNFGANPGSPWMFTSSNANNADIVVTFEGSYNDPGLNPYTAWTPAAWEAAYPANDFSAMIYDAPGDDTAPQPGSACSALATQNIGYVYVGTWYNLLPSYFSTFTADAAAGTC